MSRIITNNLRHNDATADNLTLDGTGNITAPGNLSVTGTSTLTDDLVVDTDTLFVDASADRVGINTTSPRNALHALSSNGDIRIDTSTNGGAAGLIFDVPASNGLRASGHRAKIQCEHTGSGWDSNLIFYGGNTSTEPSEQLRITSDNYLRMASGTGGIQFNGDTAAANALDDYEEGTWTPTIISNSFNGGTVTVTDSNYTKIGNQVTVKTTLQWANATGNWSAEDTFRWDNFPFASSSGNVAFGACNGVPYGPGMLTWAGYVSGRMTLIAEQASSNATRNVVVSFYAQYRVS